MDVRYLKKFAQKTVRVRATADGEKVDKLNEKSGVPFTFPAHRFDKAPQSVDKAVIADP